MSQSPATKSVISHEPSSEDAEFEIPSSTFDIGNPHSIYAKLPPSLTDRFIEARMRSPYLFDLGEDDLREKLREIGKSPTVTENQLRMRFWLEFENVMAVDTLGKMSIARVIQTVCTSAIFTSMLKQDKAVAWICCPPMSYESHLMELVNYGAYRMREIMQADPRNGGTKIDVKLVELQRKIYEQAELRAMGAVPQKIQQLNYNINDPRAVARAVEERGTSQLETRIKAMEKKDRKALDEKKVIDV